MLALLTLGLIAAVIALGAKVKDNEKSGGGFAGGSALMLTADDNAPSGMARENVISAVPGAWVPKASFPGEGSVGMSDGSAAAVGAKIYFMGGNLGGGVANNMSAGTYIYDADTDTFDIGPELPRRMARGAAAYDGTSTVYYAAGRTRRQLTRNTPPEIVGADGKEDCLFALDVSGEAKSKWQSLPCMNTPRSDFCAAWAGDKLYVLGGMTGEGDTPVASIESYTPATKRWTTEKAQLPKATVDLTCVAIGSSIYVVGGVDATSWDDPMTTWFTDAMYEINVASGTVAERAPLPRRRGDLSLARLAPNALLAIGGETTNNAGDRTSIGAHDVYSYDVAQTCGCDLLRSAARVAFVLLVHLPPVHVSTLHC